MKDKTLTYIGVGVLVFVLLSVIGFYAYASPMMRGQNAGNGNRPADAGQQLNNQVQQETVETNVEVEEYEVADSDCLLADEMIPEGADYSELSQAEIDGLLLMREEEKLARDVYLALHDEWGVNIFTNIARSEQTHTDAVKYLLDQYGLEDPVVSDERGVFENETLAGLYTDLVAQGMVSIESALTVGATIEDLDIKDLEELMAETDNEAILAVYENLTRGSRNHLRAFTSQLSRYGETYEAQFLTEEEVLEIIGGSMEQG